MVAGSSPASGARISVFGSVSSVGRRGSTRVHGGERGVHEYERTNECPADPGSSPGEGDFARGDGTENNPSLSLRVPRSLGGQDSRFSLVRFVSSLFHFSPQPRSPLHPSLSLFSQGSTCIGGFLSTGFDSQLATPRSYGLVGHNVRLTRGRSRVRTPV